VNLRLTIEHTTQQSDWYPHEDVVWVGPASDEAPSPTPMRTASSAKALLDAALRGARGADRHKAKRASTNYTEPEPDEGA
jgi:hypothetical protein